jgi:CBS domain-containing protein
MLAARITGPFRVEDLMTRDVVAVQAGEPLVTVIRKLLRGRISGAPVVDANGRLVGVISEYDVLAWQARVLDELDKSEQLDPREYARRLETTPARAVMFQPPVAIEESASVTAAVRLFVEQRRRRLPVTRQGELVGMLSRTDVLRALAEQWRSMAAHPGATKLTTTSRSVAGTRTRPGADPTGPGDRGA